jgi:PhzF family phenazine biosynthesis protein
MQQRAFRQVNVFSATPYCGNALAVVHNAAGLSDEEMQRFARWTNLAETTFLLAPTQQAYAAGADYRVRIFTPSYEMPFAGHPTLGSCHAWLEAGGQQAKAQLIVQECKAGLVPIRHATRVSPAHSGHRLAFAAPPLNRQTPNATLQSAFLQALGLQAHQVLGIQQLSNGPHHVGLIVDSVETVLALAPDLNALASTLRAADATGVGVAARYPQAPGVALIARSNREARAFDAELQHSTSLAHEEIEEPQAEVRFFALHDIVSEDPVTGSFNASLAQWMTDEGWAPSAYVVAQGSCIGRAGRVHVERDATAQVWIGGDAVTCIRGTVLL